MNAGHDRGPDVAAACLLLSMDVHEHFFAAHSFCAVPERMGATMATGTRLSIGRPFPEPPDRFYAPPA